MEKKERKDNMIISPLSKAVDFNKADEKLQDIINQAEIREKKMILSPSILAADFTVLGRQLQELDEAGAQYVHIDVMDGIFVPSISFGMPVISSIRKATDRIFDVHLMIMDPIRYVEEFAKCGADIITVHLESCDRTKDRDMLMETLKKIHGLGVRAGLTIKPGTAVEEIAPYLPEVDMFLLMTVEPGFGGQKYLPESTERIRRAKELIEKSGYDIDIEVDGGISTDNLNLVMEAGANVIVAGSAVFKGNIVQNVQDFFAAVKKMEGVKK